MSETVTMEIFSDGLNSSKQHMAKIAAATVNALKEIDAEKLDKAVTLSAEIPANSWNSGSGDYPYYSDISIPGITTSDRADIVISPGSIKTAQQVGICPFTETLGDAVRIRAEKQPNTSITAEIWILKGV